MQTLFHSHTTRSLVSHTYIYSQYNQCALCSVNLALLLRAVIFSDAHACQSVALYDCCSHTLMHHQHITLFEPFNNQYFESRSSISNPYRLTTQDLQQPPAGTSSRYSQLFKDSFNVRSTSHQIHLCVKSPNRVTLPAHTTSPSHPTFSQSPRIIHRHQQQAQE